MALLPAMFPHMNLIVKYYGSITIGKGQCLRMIRKYVGEPSQPPKSPASAATKATHFSTWNWFPKLPLSSDVKVYLLEKKDKFVPSYVRY